MTISHFDSNGQDAVNLLFGDNGPPAAAGPVAAAVATAAQQLRRDRAGDVDDKRLAAAVELVLGNHINLRLDGSAIVRSGESVYTVAGGECNCPDRQYRSHFCKHRTAVELYRMAQALLSQKSAAPAAASWNVHEAPTSCYIKMRVGHLELGYTLRDINDEHLAARLTSVLPRLNTLAEREENRREAAKAAAAEQPLAPSPAPAVDLVQLVQQAVQQVLGSATSQPPAANNGHQPAAAPQGQAPQSEASDKWCTMHSEWMVERSNNQGTWFSHLAIDRQGEYYCKGRGRTRQNRR
jgi:hypothetical protein